MYFNEKVVWVSGASSGIGEALVYELLDRGATVIASSNDRDQLQRVKKTSGSEKCHVILVDMLKQESFPGIVSELLQDFKRIDILVHVAGVSQRSLFTEIDMPVFRKIFEINFFGAVALTRTVLPHMIQQGGGQLAAVTSIVGLFGFPLRTAYSASKHAMHGFLESIQAECMDTNIHISLLVPGRVQTDISKHALTANGNVWGRMDKGQESGISTEKAAKKIALALKKKRKKVLIGGKELAIVYVKKYLPGIFWRLVTKIKST